MPTTKPDAGAAPFLTKVDVKEWTGNRSIVGDPAIGKNLKPQLYWGQPFALNVPVEQPFDGGDVRIYFIVHDRFDFDAKSPFKARGMFRGEQTGIYPLDGKALAENSLREDSMKGDGIKPIEKSAAPNYHVFHNNYFSRELTPTHQPFTDENGKTRLGSYLSLSPARPGWYVLWWEMDPIQWPWEAREQNSIDVTFVVDTLVQRGEGPSFDWLEYLFGRGKKPTTGNFDPNLLRFTTHELKITFRKDGWNFSRIEVKPKGNADKFLAQKQATYDDYHDEAMLVQPTVSVGAPSADLRVVTTVTPKPKKKPPGTPVVEDMSWHVEFPQVVLDADKADVTISAKRTLKPENAPSTSTKPPWFEQWKPFARGSGGATMESWMPPPTTHDEFIGNLKYARLDQDDWFQQLWLKEAADKPKLDVPVPFRFYHRGLTSSDLDTKDRQTAFVEGKTEEPLLTADCGPWEVIAYYKRLKDIESLGDGGGPSLKTVQVVKEIDPYWDWYAKHCQLVAKKRQDLEEYKRIALSLGTLMSVTRRDVELLTVTLPIARKEAAGDDDPLETNTSRKLRHIVEFVYGSIPDVGQWFATSPIQEPGAVVAKRQATILDLKSQLADYRKQLDENGAHAQDVLTDIIKDLDNAGVKYAANHPHLISWQNQVETERERLPLDLALATGDRDAIMTEVEKLGPKAVSAGTRALVGQIYLSEGDVIPALVAFRQAMNIDPKNRQAVEGRRVAETAILRTALFKSQATVKIARDNFYRYMKERGFDAELPTTQPVNHDVIADSVSIWSDPRLAMMPSFASPYWPQLMNFPLSKNDIRDVLMVVMSGIPGAISAGIYNRPGAEADLLNAYEESMAKAFMGLHMIIYLRAANHELADILNANTKTLMSWLPPSDMHGKPFTEQTALPLALAIHEAKQLDEVTALLTEDDATLKVALEKQSYWSRSDIADTWAEWVGDITSIKNVVTLLLPYAIHTTAPRLSMGFWGTAEMAEAQQLVATGEAISGTEALARFTGWSKALQAFGATNAGKRLVVVLERYHDYMKYLEKAAPGSRLTWSAGTLMGTILIQSVAAHYAEKWDMPQLNLIVEGCLLFGNDTEMLVKFMKQRNMPTAKIRDVIRQQLLPAIQQEEKQLASMETSGKDLLKLMDDRKASKTLTSNDQKLLGTTLVGEKKNPLPIGQSGHDIPHVLESMKEDISAGVDHGASDAFKTLQSGLQKEEEDLSKLGKDADKISNSLDSAASSPEPESKPPPGPPTRQEQDAPLDWGFKGPNGPVQYKVPPTPHPDSKCAQALAALDAENYPLAIQLLEEAKRDADVGLAPPDFELPSDMIDWYIQIARKAPSAKMPTVPIPEAVELSAAIPQSDVDRILAMPRKELDFGNKAIQGKKYAINDGEFFLKELTPEDFVGKVPVAGSVEEELKLMAEAELVKAALYEHVGLADGRPGVAIQMIRNDKGELEKVNVIFRGVRGKSMANVSPQQFFLVRKKMSKFRAADLVMGDFDRKPGNFMIHGDGRPISVDAGYADPGGMRYPRRDGSPPEAPRYMEGYLGMDHYYVRGIQDNNKGLVVVESLLTYDAAKDTIHEIEQLLLTPEGKAKLEQRLLADFATLYPPEEAARRVKVALDGMTRRAGRLDQVMQRLNLRQGKKLPGPSSDAAPLRLQDFLDRIRLFTDYPLRRAA